MECTTCGAATVPGTRFCGMCGAPLKAAARRERRKVSVVFIDLAGFTTITHGFDPERLRDLADEVLTVVAGIVEEFDGHVDSFRGDGLVAVFGAPHSHPDDPERAVQAAATGLRAIERIGAAKETGLKGRAGVATGTVIAGALGSGRVREYTVMGSTVNLAARIEQAATPGQVWVCPATYKATRFRLGFDSSPAVTLAGFPDVTELFVLRSGLESASEDPFGHLEFVGRQAELARVHELHVRTLRGGRSSELWITGGTGIGKTRLVREFVARHLAAPARILWPEERSGSSFSWFPLARAVFAPADGDAATPWQARIHERLAELLPDEPRWQRHILASLGLSEEGTWTRLERRRVNRTSLAWRDLLVALARHDGQPLVLVIEGAAQDQPLLDLLDLLREAEAPILVLRVTRAREQAEGTDVLALRPLTVAESLQLLNQLADPVMRPAADALVYQVGGVPAYILELGRSLSVWEEGSIAGSLEGVLQARLDRLGPGARPLLELAAMTGERTWESLLLKLAEQADEDAVEGLRTLVEDNVLLKLVDSSIENEVEYRFQSELLRHAVLQMVPYSERPLLHLRIATWLEQNAPLALSEMIGDQFRAGGSHDAAFAHYLTALEQALADGQAPPESLVRSLGEIRLQDEDPRLANALADARDALAHDRDREASATGAAAAEASTGQAGEREPGGEAGSQIPGNGSGDPERSG